MAVHNVHERTIHAEADVVGALLDELGRDGDRLWPSPAWEPMRLDRPLQVGAAGGHGPIRYRVGAYEPGRRVRFEFHPGLGIDGYHELTVTPAGAGRCVVRHVIEGRLRGPMRLLWPLVVRWLHDAVLEDLLDNAERAATGQVTQPAQWSAWVRFWRRHTEFPLPRAADLPPTADLARSAFDTVDRSDAWTVPLLPGAPTDPLIWAHAIFRAPPRPVVALLWLRNRLVRLVGIEPGDHSAFDLVDRTANEVLLGSDADHLDFRASVLVGPEAVTLTTVVRTHHRRGRAYLRLVWPFHSVIVRSMLHRARHRLGKTAARPEPGLSLVTSSATESTR